MSKGLYQKGITSRLLRCGFYVEGVLLRSADQLLTEAITSSDGWQYLEDQVTLGEIEE